MATEGFKVSDIFTQVGGHYHSHKHTHGSHSHSHSLMAIADMPKYDDDRTEHDVIEDIDRVQGELGELMDIKLKFKEEKKKK